MMCNVFVGSCRERKCIVWAALCPAGWHGCDGGRACAGGAQALAAARGTTTCSGHACTGVWVAAHDFASVYMCVQEARVQRQLQLLVALVQANLEDAREVLRLAKEVVSA